MLETLLVGLLRIPLLGGLLASLLRAMHVAAVRAMRRLDRDSNRPRHWSNRELRKLGAKLGGNVINVSGWRDEDKDGGKYRDYFPSATAYTVSNYYGAKGMDNGVKEVFLDLEAPLPTDMQGQYDVVFNHTVLEHVFEIRTAVKNLCALSRDAVLLVTPFLQHVHDLDESFGDYWRPTPQCLVRMLKENGMEVVYQSCNDTPWSIVYVVTLATRQSGKFAGQLGSFNLDDAGKHHFSLD